MEILRTNKITKIFPGVIALDSVSISFDSGQIHCIIGENGAGKSTLIKCITGLYEPECGEIFIDGQNVNDKKNLFKKIAYVPQEIDLFEHLSVAENLFMPYESKVNNKLINQRKLENLAKPILSDFSINVSPDDLVKNISVSSQQLLQIARAIIRDNYDVLLLDEPTTSLTTEDTKILFKIIRGIKKEGKAVVFISHKLEEIFEIGDVITVFRNGKKVAFSNLSEIDIPTIIKQMTGRDIKQEVKFYSERVQEEVILEVKKLCGKKFNKIDFELHKGEILGFAGLVGAGRSELLQAIFGYLSIYSGEVFLNGQRLKPNAPYESVERGLIYIPEERKKQGILPMLSVRENISVLTLKNLLDKGIISKNKELKLAEDMIGTYKIKTSDTEKEIRYLSGGNQQKVIIGRTMCSAPQVIIFDEPTKGIDVGTKVEIYKLMKILAEEGLGIILISSEMEEVIKCSNRVITLYEGKKIQEFSYDIDKEEILSSIIGVKKNGGCVCE